MENNKKKEVRFEEVNSNSGKEDNAEETNTKTINVKEESLKKETPEEELNFNPENTGSLMECFVDAFIKNEIDVKQSNNAYSKPAKIKVEKPNQVCTCKIEKELDKTDDNDEENEKTNDDNEKIVNDNEIDEEEDGDYDETQDYDECNDSYDEDGGEGDDENEDDDEKMDEENEMRKKKKKKRRMYDDDDDEDDEEKYDQFMDEMEYENYLIWKKNCPFLYDLIITNSLKWPSTTIQWCQSKQTKINPTNYREYFTEKLLFGTQVDKDHASYLIVGTQHIPIIDHDEIAACEGGVSHTKYAKIEYYVQINHEGDVNRARYNPQNSFIIATTSSSKKNYIFDYSKHPSEPINKEFKPELILEYDQQKEGYGLCWNNRKSNILATGSLDETVCVWDINSNPYKLKTLSPTNSFKAHKGPVNDVKWHYYHDSYLGTVGNDWMLKFWDMRMDCETKSAFSCQAHTKPINSLSFNPFCEYIILTASDDYTVGLFDIRNLKHQLHVFDGHRDEVLDVNWSPYCETVFASSGRDKRLIIWDMTKINSKDRNNDEGPPEMLFIHGGHTDVVHDFAWHPHKQLIASVSGDNELHVFKPSIEFNLSV